VRVKWFWIIFPLVIVSVCLIASTYLHDTMSVTTLDNKPEIVVRDGRTQEDIDDGIGESWTIKEIAQSIGMDVSVLMTMNGILDPESIYPGQVLKIQPYSLFDEIWVSWYEEGPNETTSNGEVFDPEEITTCAHRWLPFETRVRLTYLETEVSIEVVVRDRGPYADMEKRHFDISRGAAEQLGIIDIGVAECHVEILGLEE
jgi:hypothetical protein